ncbi:ATP-binding protein [Aminobacter sp. SS-2016]|uniref:DEAD/DEAH box helicase n=1 Tax=Aminobacter sp. Y103A TaxID=1870862 RepID=UPI00257324C8|nr:ATP-binding protein [Aminobacter sp. SS-2016]
MVRQTRSEGKSIRIVVTGPTWIAIDNVLRKLPGRLKPNEALLVRLKSTEAGDAGIDPVLLPYVVANTPSDGSYGQMMAHLDASQTVIVGATAQQIGRLMRSHGGEVGLFDYLLIDEASQMDVAYATVAMSSLVGGASVTVVGDDLQMAPIHPIDPPVGSEHLVGSIYDFFKHYRRGQTNDAGESRGLTPVMLDRSYRSNREIVEFVETTGYEKLTAEFPDLRTLVTPPFSAERPEHLAAGLAWSPAMAEILNPEHPLVAVVHSDRYSSQRNDSEAALVTSLVASLAGRLVNPETDQPFDPKTFFEKGIGIVTPHRAQQAAVIECLIAALDPDEQTADAIVRAVDTVERFQGQEKTVMFASFGLGDGDQIATEEEFLYNLNRFNVVVSRAKTKMVVVLSRRVADYLPKDIKALRHSRLLKNFVYGFLRTGSTFSVAGLEDLGECELRVR